MAYIKTLKMGLPSQNLYNVKAVKVSSIEVGKVLETLRAEELLALYGCLRRERVTLLWGVTTINLTMSHCMTSEPLSHEYC